MEASMKHKVLADGSLRKVGPLRISPLFIGWLASLLLLHLVGAGVWDSKQLQLAVAVLGLAHSMTGFWTDGGQRISAPGVYFFAAALFAYFPGMYLSLNPSAKFYYLDLTPAITIILVVQMLMYHLFWQYRKTHRVPNIQFLSAKTARPVMVIGLLLLITGVLASFATATRSPVVGAFVYSGLVLFAVAALRREKSALLSYLVIAVGFFLYVEFIFSGFGRLNIGSLGLALAITATHRWSGRTVKTLLIAASAPVLIYMATARVEFTSTLVSDVDSSVTGFESVLSPLARFSQLLDMSLSGVLEHTWGHSLFSSAVVLVPRELWPAKPVGLGAELGHLFRPDLSDSYTALALVHGEAVYGFGVLGLFLLIPVFAWVVILFDRMMVQLQTGTTVNVPDVILMAGGVLFTASVVDLVWGGTFTFASRVGPRLIIIFALYGVMYSLHKVSSASHRRRSSNRNFLNGKRRKIDIGRHR